jgi:hypothetical protein
VKTKIGEGSPDGYALGFLDTYVDGVRSFGHSGGAPGMSSELKIYPKSTYVVSVLSNLDPPAASLVSEYITDRLPLSKIH